MKIIKFITVFFLSFLGTLAVGLMMGSWISGMTLAETWEKIRLNFGESIGIPLLAIFTAVLAAVVHIILHEAGHWLFGLASGYRFLSFRVFNLVFYMEEGRVKIKKYSVDGTLGQCLMLPPEASPERIPVVAYNLGGVVINLTLCIIFGTALFFCSGHPIAAVVCAMLVITGLFLVIMNGIPMIVGGCPNDGMNALKLRKSVTSRKAFASLLMTNAMVQNGIRPRNLGDELFLRPEEVDFSEPIQVNSLMAYASKLMDSGNLDGSLAIYREIMEKAGKVKILTYEAKCEAAGILLMRDEVEEAKALLNSQDMKLVEAYAKSMSSKLRLLFLLALKADGDRKKAHNLYDQCIKRRDSYLMRGEVVMDLELMQTANGHDKSM